VLWRGLARLYVFMTTSQLTELLVIDLTHVLNGPFGTTTLTDLGARVIKIEPPGHGDGTRTTTS
jgi:CoA:oxalate CoA-transferase